MNCYVLFIFFIIAYLFIYLFIIIAFNYKTTHYINTLDTLMVFYIGKLWKFLIFLLHAKVFFSSTRLL